MAVPAYRPRLWWQLCFNADPNDPTVPRLWSDYTAIMRQISVNKRGRQYELGQSMGAEPVIIWRDVNEYFNPANTSSPHYPFVQPYRFVLGQAMYPPEPVGSAVNLLNLGNWKANDAVAPDPSFESYANGAARPGWLTALGGVTATVTTTNPQAGTKSLTWAQTTATAREGVSWTAPCIPGQQYTTSAYVRQSAASTLQLLVGGQTLVYDAFLTSGSSGWPAAPIGGTYTLSGGAASDYSVTGAAAGGTAKMSHNSVNVRRTTYLAGTTATDHNAVVRLSCPVVATGASITMGLMLRTVDLSNFYLGVLAFNTDQTLTLTIREVAGGVGAILGTASLPWSYMAGQKFWMRFEAVSTTLRVRVWPDGTPEPAADIWDLSVTDTSVTAPGSAGCHSRLETGNTNGTTVLSFEKLSMVGAVSSTTTTTTGSYVRLTSTFTATQDQHTISVGQVGAGVAGTVNLDSVQHETGASASTFSSTGPSIFPLLYNNVERWRRGWDAKGFVGLAGTPAVDGFASLNSISINTEFISQVLYTRPYYYWPLSSAGETLQALEVSGNNGPALVQLDSKYGAGNAPAFGSAISIAGDPGGTGVRFEPTNPGGSNQPDSMLSCGRVPVVPGILFPAVYSGTWSASVCAWIQLNVSTLAGNISYAFPSQSTLPLATVPIALVGVDGNVQVAIQHSSGAATAAASPTEVLADLLPHFVVGTVTQANGGNTVLKIYVDGVLLNTTTVTTASLGGLMSTQATKFNVGGNTTGGGVPDGVVAHVGLWDRALSAAEITDLYSAGTGWPGETTGERWDRHLDLGRWNGRRRISAGSTILQPATQSGLTDLLSDGNQLALAELGTHWVAPDGADVFEGRQERWLRLTSVAMFGEDVAAGEIPYLDGVEFDFDPFFVYANVRITRNEGAVAVGGTAADINTATAKYFGRSYAIGADFVDDQTAQYYADYVFNTHKRPLLRVSQIVVDPSSNPSLYAQLLLLEVGQRVTVKRRAKAANGGTGLTMSADYFIEAVGHNAIDMDRGTWNMGFLLSPINAGAVNPSDVSMQPWVLEHATYGVLDSTTFLGW